MAKTKNIRPEPEITEETPASFGKHDLAIPPAAARFAPVAPRDWRAGAPVGHNLLESHQAPGARRRRTTLYRRHCAFEIGVSRYGDRPAALASHNEETPKAFADALETIPEVMDAFLVSGDYDYYIRIAVRSTGDYERLLRDKLYKIPGIRHRKSSFVLRTLKDTRMPVV